MGGSSSRRSLLVAVLGGILYTTVVLYWAETTGIRFVTDAGGLPVASLAYAMGGPMLLSAVPLYVLSRYGLVLPAAVSCYFLVSTV